MEIITGIQIGDIIVISADAREVDLEMAESRSRGLSTGFRVEHVMLGGLFVSDLENQEMFYVVKDSIYKVFKEQDKYEKWAETALFAL